MSEPDAIARIVSADLERRADGGEPISQTELGRKADPSGKLWKSPAVAQAEISYWLRAERSISADKAAAILHALDLVIVPRARVRKRRK